MAKGAFVELTEENNIPSNGKDQVVIINPLGYISGGRSLDVSAVTDTAIYAGHIIVKDKTTDVFRPLEVAGTDFSDIKTTDEIVGVLASSIKKKKAFAGIVTMGIVNDLAMPFKVSAALMTKIKTALPALQFQHD